MLSSGKNSTNVRANPSQGRRPKTPPLGAIRGAMRALTLVSPSLSSRWAYSMFTTPRRHARPEREQRRLQDAEAFTFESDGLSLAAWRWGEGPQVLLLHGWEGRGSQLGAFVEPLLAAGFGVLTFDGPAHGDSPGRQVTPGHLARAVRDLAEHVGGLHAVVAHSMGGLATSFALREGLEVDRVVFVSPGSHPSDATGALGRVLDLPPSVLRRVRESVAAAHGRTWDEVAAEDPFAAHRPPLFIAHDIGDKDVPMRVAEHITDVWGEAELYRTAGLGHRRILRDAEVVRRAVEFLRAPSDASLPAPAP